MAELSISTTTLWQNRKCLFLCSLVSMANLQYGFDLAAIGSLQAMPGFLKVFGYPDPGSETGYAIDSTVQQLITSLLTLGSFVSSLVAGFFSAYLGRRHALWLACIVNAIACAIQIGAPSAGPLYVGRLLLGFANGFLVTFSNIYTAEASPAHLRGVMVALFAYWVNIGSILGAAVDNKTKERMDRLSYRIPLACLYIVPTFLSMALFFVPESPRWLLHRGKVPAARQALEQLRGTSYATLRASSSDDEIAPSLLELEWAEMIKGVEEERREQGTVTALNMFRGELHPFHLEKKCPLIYKCNGIDLRRTILCYCMIGCQSASGVWFLIGYQTYFFSVSGITKAFEFSIMNTCFGFLGVNIGMYAIRNWLGRRAILMLGAVACGLCQLGSAIAATVSPNSLPTGQALVAFTALFMFFYNGCVGAASYPVATELVRSRLRAWTVGTATSLGYLLAWLVNFCTPYFINPEHLNWGARYGYIWAGSNLACVVFFYFFIPEMKGRSLEELDEIFAAGVSARRFASYQCLIGEAARIDAVHAEGRKHTLDM
ncbi:general substrate transporter [Aspergillus pseudonomiae]|uniref:General substrate transporter n=1 Tax=Aspergillus pseudonomiae TaxID=1506151 RepID=A0A5N6I674_9EURO|nr:general substrate transporter [Aspergillus pseudonomiae]KAB8261240.1 general substrate transporter [Aspergillus pseudonomiae]KAE8398090.1 general substrate transporter [Aspergillus pseudonomiae]